MRRGGAIGRTTAGPTVIRGFSLVEILVSFTILALFVATAFHVYVTGIRSTALAGEYARAQTLARSQLDALAAVPALTPSEEAGRTALHGDGPIFRWRTRVKEYPLPDAAGGDPDSSAVPLLAVVEVTWDGESRAGTTRRIEFRALLLGEPG